MRPSQRSGSCLGEMREYAFAKGPVTEKKYASPLGPQFRMEAMRITLLISSLFQFLTVRRKLADSDIY